MSLADQVVARCQELEACPCPQCMDVWRWAVENDGVIVYVNMPVNDRGCRAHCNATKDLQVLRYLVLRSLDSAGLLPPLSPPT